MNSMAQFFHVSKHSLYYFYIIRIFCWHFSINATEWGINFLECLLSLNTIHLNTSLATRNWIIISKQTPIASKIKNVIKKINFKVQKATDGTLGNNRPSW